MATCVGFGVLPCPDIVRGISGAAVSFLNWDAANHFPDSW